MQVGKEELLKIANLASLKIEEKEMEDYLLNLENILEFTDIVNKAPVEGLDITIGSNNAYNRFRKDEVKEFKDTKSLLQNAEEKSQNMFKIPKVLN